MTARPNNRRSIQTLADRLVPIIEPMIRANETITYRQVSSLISRRGETVVAPQLIGKVLDYLNEDAATGGYPNQPWMRYASAFVVRKDTGEVSTGWADWYTSRGLPSETPTRARAIAYGEITQAWMGEATGDWSGYENDINAA